MAIALLVCACVDAESNPAAIPPKARWLVFLELDGVGVLRSAVGPVPAEAPVAVLGRASAQGRRLLLGYTDEAIRALAPDLDSAALASRAAREPPRLATGCDPLLPTPVFESELLGQTWGTGEPAPPLTATWLEGRCPEAAPELWFDLSECATHWCPRELRTKSACTYEVGFSGCQLSALEIRVEQNAQLCGSGIAAEPARGLEPSVLLQDSFEVQCRVGVAPRQPLAATVRRWSFRELVPGFEGPKPRFLTEPSSHVLTRDVPYGGASDFVVLNDRVLVSLVHGAVETCLDRAPSGPRLARFVRSGDELTDVRTATASPCLYHLEPDPGGESFLGAYATGSAAFALARFDREGRELARSELTVDLDSIEVRGLVIHHDAVFVTLRGRVPPDGYESGIIRFDLGSLSPELGRSRYWRSPEGARETSIEFGRLKSAGRFLLVSEIQDNAVHVMDPEQNFVSATARSRRGGPRNSDLAFDPVGGRLFAAGRDYERAGFVAHAETESCFARGSGARCDWTALQFAGEDSIGLRLSAWPGRPDWMASFVGVQRGDRVATLLSVIDLKAQPSARYRPVAVEVSTLSVFKVHTDETSLWALVPDEASLLRITP